MKIKLTKTFRTNIAASLNDVIDNRNQSMIEKELCNIIWSLILKTVRDEGVANLISYSRSATIAESIRTYLSRALGCSVCLYEHLKICHY